jgi:hypothetical protein
VLGHGAGAPGLVLATEVANGLGIVVPHQESARETTVYGKRESR